MTSSSAFHNQRHDAVHVIKQACLGQDWAQNLIFNAYEEVYGPGSDQRPDFEYISNQSEEEDQELIDFLKAAWGYEQDQDQDQD